VYDAAGGTAALLEAAEELLAEAGAEAGALDADTVAVGAPVAPAVGKVMVIPAAPQYC